ncbi:MAG TPA: hypothetical protein VLK33_10640 [Terriglobales bacterium]|nr:hypothetical protein [Terriglobales bacterium]
MKKLTGVLLGLSFVVGGICTVAAQEGTTPPPKVLVLYREFIKPGKSGSLHEKSESAFVQALTKAKSSEHYFAVDSLSGRQRSLFLFPYDSFDAWEKDVMNTQKNAALSAALDRAGIADGELQSDMDTTVLMYREDQSLRGPVDIAHMRLFEISLYQVRPGHRKDWDDLVKLVMAAYEKIPDAHWATFEVAYGQQANATYAIFVPRKAASEIDQSFAQEKDFVKAMGEDGMKKLRELETAAIESTQTNLFVFNPRMSYPPDAWVKADPDFWKPKAAPAAAKKAADKPVNSQ